MPTFEPKQFHGEPWTPAQLRRLRKLLARNTPLVLTALKLGRTVNAVRKKALELAAAGRARRRGAQADRPRS
jgi:hypothetical protein